MFAATFQYYPSGVRTPLMQGFKSETLVDEEWLQLKKLVNSHKVYIDSIDYRKLVVKHARRLFGNFREWLDAQDQNTRLSVNGYEYLVDTIEFLNKGFRTVSAGSRMALIASDFAHSNSTNPKAENRRTRLRDLLQINPDEFIYVWCNQPNGFSDMICTVDLLFGTDPSADSNWRR